MPRSCCDLLTRPWLWRSFRCSMSRVLGRQYTTPVFSSADGWRGTPAEPSWACFTAWQSMTACGGGGSGDDGGGGGGGVCGSGGGCRWRWLWISQAVAQYPSDITIFLVIVVDIRYRYLLRVRVVEEEV